MRKGCGCIRPLLYCCYTFFCYSFCWMWSLFYSFCHSVLVVPLYINECGILCVARLHAQRLCICNTWCTSQDTLNEWEYKIIPCLFDLLNMVSEPLHWYWDTDIFIHYSLLVLLYPFLLLLVFYLALFFVMEKMNPQNPLYLHGSNGPNTVSVDKLTDISNYRTKKIHGDSPLIQKEA